ncbi:MAG: ATP-binding cassette domain-containing protein [Acidimicrobiia bacterium]
MENPHSPARAHEPPQSAIRANQLTKNFNGDTGVFDVDLEVKAGTILGLIGPSGSGKTTTVRLLAGLLTPSSGTAEVFGERPVNFKRETRARLGYMPQDSILYPALTLRQNLDFAGSLFGIRRTARKERIDKLIDFLELESAADRLPAASSGGERRRNALASTLIHNPDLVFLDEPTAGLDPVLRRKLWDRFDDLARSGRTLVVTTQYVGEAAYCDHVAVLANGRVLIVDTPQGLRRRAFGGEPVDVAFVAPISAAAMGFLTNMTSGVAPLVIDDHSVRIVADDPGETVPRILEWGLENGVEIERAEAFAPPFDDIFVELVEQLSENNEEASDNHEEVV